jgi:hypothetical protein
MGTSLTGLTPATTYDALIKVGDNGALSATAKYLSDGLGNDSALALSTSMVGINTTTPSLQGFNNELTISAGVSGTKRTALNLQGSRTTASTFASIGFYHQANFVASVESSRGGADNSASLEFFTSDAGTNAERMRITSAGNVGIGTTTPNTPLSIVGEHVGGQSTLKIQPTTSYALGGLSSIGFNDSDGVRKGLVLQEASGIKILTENTTPIRFEVNNSERGRWTTDGLCFNGDTSAANALDDYEEGTWTMGITFNGSSTGITYVNNTGTYTKIGRQVTVNGLIQLSSKGSDTGSARISGLPFTIPNISGHYSTATLWFFNIDFANQFQSVADVNNTTISLFETTESGTITALNDTDFANNSEIILSLTYFV